jgi:hypothetical protein
VRHDDTGSGRGRHKGARSAETKRWHELEARTPWLRNQHGIRVMSPPVEAATEPPAKPKPAEWPPRRPSWLDTDCYRALLELRGTL